MTTGVFHPRRLGARLLVAPIGEDCLGSVYRALHSSDERRFVRLRVLQSPELSPAAVFSAIARNGDTVGRLSHKAIVQHAELSVEDGTPFVAWYESAGWTLDVVLARLRSAAAPLPVPFALLIAERVCAALEHAWFSPLDGEPIRHGLVWPGFVSISNDAEVRLGGFGLADAILPTISQGRIARDVGPYAAPEARESGRVGAAADAYSAGVLLLELLTCRRPASGAATESLRADDSLGIGIRGLLARCFAPAPERFTILELHRALQEHLAAGPAPVSSADLAFFLYTLLNPESRGLPAANGNSTNPIRERAARTNLDEPVPDRRRSDFALESDSVALFGSEDEPPSPSAFVPQPVYTSARLLSVERAPTPRTRRSAAGWIRGAASVAVAVAIIIGFESLAARRERAGERPATPLFPAAVAALPRASNQRLAAPARILPDRPAEAQPAPPLETAAQREIAGPTDHAQLVVVHARSPKGSVAASARRTAAAVPSAADVDLKRRDAEAARFQAAWARIEADRGEASELAADAFAEGKTAEAEADVLLRAREYDRAREGFGRAASLFRNAESSARSARLARIQISAPSF